MPAPISLSSLLPTVSLPSVQFSGKSKSKRQVPTSSTQSSKAQILQDEVFISQVAASANPQGIQNKQQLNMQVMCSLLSGDIEKVQEALDNGASVRMAGEYSPLHWSVKQGYKEIAALLLKHGAKADINEKDLKGKSPLEYAFDNEQSEKLATGLLLSGADPAALPQEVQQAKAAFFSQALKRMVTFLDVPTTLAFMQKRSSTAILDKKKLNKLERQQETALSVAQKIINADIPGLDLTPSEALCNDILTRTNAEVLKFQNEKKNEIAKTKLGSARYILRLGVPLNNRLLIQYAQLAAGLATQNASEDAAQQEVSKDDLDQNIDHIFDDELDINPNIDHILDNEINPNQSVEQILDDYISTSQNIERILDNAFFRNPDISVFPTTPLPFDDVGDLQGEH